jgi:hypothetical protein
MGDNPAFLILRWQALTTGNGLRDLAKKHKIDIVVTIFTVAIAGMYLAEAVVRNAAMLRAEWPIVSMSALGASGVLDRRLVDNGVDAEVCVRCMDCCSAHFGHGAVEIGWTCCICFRVG